MSIDKDGLRPTSGFTLDTPALEPGVTYDAFRSYEATKTYAKSQGWSVVLPKGNELFLDYDTDDEKKAGLKLLRLFSKYYQNSTLSEKYKFRRSSADLKNDASPVLEVFWWRSKSGVGWHAKATMPFNITNLERIGLQAIFGSDRAREVFSFLREIRGDSQATIFFELDPTKVEAPQGEYLYNKPESRSQILWPVTSSPVKEKQPDYTGQLFVIGMSDSDAPLRDVPSPGVRQIEV